MRVRARAAAVIALQLLAVALAGGACAGGPSETHKEEATSAQAPGEPPQRSRHATAAWPHAKVLKRIAGETIEAAGRRVRVDRATVTCGGEGPGSRRGRERVWERFTCIQPTFNSTGTAGPDVVFRVQPTGRRSFRVTDQRVTRY